MGEQVPLRRTNGTQTVWALNSRSAPVSGQFTAPNGPNQALWVWRGLGKGPHPLPAIVPGPLARPLLALPQRPAPTPVPRGAPGGRTCTSGSCSRAAISRNGPSAPSSWPCMTSSRCANGRKGDRARDWLGPGRRLGLELRAGVGAMAGVRSTACGYGLGPQSGGFAVYMCLPAFTDLHVAVPCVASQPTNATTLRDAQRAET